MTSKKTLIKRFPHTTKLISRKIKKIDDKMISVKRKLEVTYLSRLLKFQDLGEFYFMTRDPVDILVQHAKVNIKTINKLKTEFLRIHKNHKIELTAKEEDLTDRLIINSISIPIILACILETFVNKVIFKNNLFIKCHLEVQRHVPLEKKLFNILPEISYQPAYFKNNVELKRCYDDIIDTRNKIVHQKSKTEDNLEAVTLVQKLLDTNWNSVLGNIEKLIKDFESLPLV